MSPQTDAQNTDGHHYEGTDTLLGGGAGEYGRMPVDHGGVAVARTLQANGVDRVFALPGGHIAPVLNACEQIGIDVVTTRHESSAVFMAEAVARATGRTGVAAVTAGPGFTNAVTGIANAEATGIPVAVLGGRTPLALRGKGAVQDADQETVARAVGKWAKTVTQSDDLAVSTREALALARAGRCGSAYLDLPTDVLTASTPAGEPPLVSPRPRPAADADMVEAAVKALAEAERPIVIAGGGAFWAGAGESLRAFVEHTGIPVTTTSHSRGLVPDSHPNCLGSLLHGGVGVAFADVVLIVGSRFNGNLMFGREPLWRADHRIISIDIDPAAFTLNRAPDVALHGDAAVVLDQLRAAWAGANRQAWSDEAKGFTRMSWDHWVSETEGEAKGVHPGFLALEVCNFMAEHAGSTLVLDGGDILGWGLAFSQCEEPGSMMFTSDALGTLGVGVPYAVAAPFVRPDGPTVALIGDGAFGLSAMEIETAVRYGTAPIIVVSNNGSWGDVRYEEGQWFGGTVGTDLTSARYDQLAIALGGHGERVERHEDLRPALERALASGRASVIDVVTDPDRPNEVLRNMHVLNLQ